MLDRPDWKALNREERAAIVYPLVIEGLSSTQIAAHFTNITRNSIIGLCHRNKWQLKGGPGRNANQIANAKVRKAKPHGNKSQPKVNAIIAKTRSKPPTPPPIEPEPFDMEDGPCIDVTARIGLMENTGCHYIHGDPLLPTHSYCGKATQAGFELVRTPPCPRLYRPWRSAMTHAARDTNRLQTILVFCGFPLGIWSKSMVEKANAPDARNIAARSDHKRSARIEMADSHSILALGFRRNPDFGSARP